MSFFYDTSFLGAGFKHGESRREPDEVGLRPEAISYPQRFPKRQRGNRPERKYVQGNAGTTQHDFIIAVGKVCAGCRFTECFFCAELIFDDEFRGSKSS